MNNWVHFIPNQWYRMLYTRDIIWVYCELNKISEVYYVISYYQTRIQHLYFLLNKFSLWAQNFMDMGKIALVLYCYIHYLISHYLPRDWQITLMGVINKTVSIFTWQFCIIYVWIHVSKINKLSTIKNKVWA